jgi:hypothetical protein
MSFFASKIVAPVYRLFFGPPLAGLETVHPAGGADPPRHQALTIVADGVGGFDVCGTGLQYIMGAAGLSHAVEVYPWGHGSGRWLADLTDVANRDAKARSIAEMVKNFKMARPEGLVFLVAKSGGAGVVICALERLEADAVERVVLLAPALSPKYDLSQALHAVHREIVVFWSPLDVFILGLGTLIFGTIDRVHTAGAGLVGFAQPGFAQPALRGSLESSNCAYSRVRQIRWRPAMITTGYLGGHFGTDSPLFLKKYVLPLLQPEFRKEY